MNNNFTYICNTRFEGDVKSVKIQDRNFFICKHHGDYRMFEGLCPHMGGDIKKEKNYFRCTTHNWKFDLLDGSCKTSPKLKLPEFKILIKDDKIYANIFNKTLKKSSKKKFYKKDLNLQLHSHACLEITYKKVKILTDPWFNGPAFLGAWINYPPNKVDSTKINPDLIWISHEHSDHFHPETLKLFRRDIPIYFPDFPNERILKQLKNLGFKNLFPMPFGKRVEINNSIHITCFQPNSPWNDSMLLMEFDDFKFLNLNDAGVNHKIKNIVGDVDVISTAFTTGASGFPLTWPDLTHKEKLTWIQNDQKGQTQMILNAVKMYNCRFVLPFAGHFQLWHPNHRKYVSLIGTIKVCDVKKTLKDSPAKLIEMLPGDKFSFKNLQVVKKTGRMSNKELYSPDRIKEYLDESFDKKVFDNFYPQKHNKQKKDVIDYFLRFNKSPEIIFCENIILNITSNNYCDLYFKIKDGKITHLRNKSKSVNIQINLPKEILQEIISLDMSWDEAQIGYWCETRRWPKDKYNINFWRMLQAPYYKRKVNIQKKDTSKNITKSSSILKIISKQKNNLATKILNRYGLYCHSCVFSTMEDIHTASLKHGLSEDQSQNLIRELNEIT